MLEIERRRHAKPQRIPLEQRTCQQCTSNSVDDENHFFITCSYFVTSIHRELVYLPKANYTTLNLIRSQTTTNLYTLCHLHIDR